MVSPYLRCPKWIAVTVIYAYKSVVAVDVIQRLLPGSYVMILLVVGLYIRSVRRMSVTSFPNRSGMLKFLYKKNYNAILACHIFLMLTLLRFRISGDAFVNCLKKCVDL